MRGELAAADSAPTLTVAIPTYRRGAVLLETLERLAEQTLSLGAILVLDQTERHEPEVESRLLELQEQGTIRWLRLPRPSIPAAMNEGLRRAEGEIVLFLDDDVVPSGALVSAHLAAHREHPFGLLVAGRVVQPWESDSSGTGFASEQPWAPQSFMGGNFSLRRSEALEIGGFDENFVGAAYRYEAEFADRWLDRGGTIRFVPEASIDHLHVDAGGTRSSDHHLRTWRPTHAVGEYYYLLTSPRAGSWLRGAMARWRGALFNRHHLRRPWWAGASLVAEIRGMVWALRLRNRGPRLALQRSTGEAP